jgi:hypothetical protein
VNPLDTLDRTGPLVDDGHGWPRYQAEVTEAVVERGYWDVRTPEQVEADEWVRELHWAHQSVPWSFLLDGDFTVDGRGAHPLRAEFYNERWLLSQEVRAIVFGGLAPSELHARRLAMSFFDWHERFIRNITEERAAYLAVCVLSGWEAAHGG